MQILIDTVTDTDTDLASAAELLDAALRNRRATVTQTHVDVADTSHVRSVIDGLGCDAAAAIKDAPLPSPPPPPPPYDPDVTTDGEGNVTALTTSVHLPTPAPTIPPAAPVPPGAVVEYDSRGYPWDGRIHASNRARKIDQSWKYRRGVDPNTIVAVEAAIKPGPTSTPVVPAAVTSIPSATGAAFLAGTTPLNLLPPPPPPPAPAAVSAATSSAAPATVAAAPIDFRGLMIKISSATSAGKLTHDQVNAVFASVGLGPADVSALIDNPTLIAGVNAGIEACLTK